ncbi:hypothetical protein [Brevibacillus agri]|uniref:hypothetical protein n=1 Tax=Brevibacillus agri TaxID=51101 RepID=UPI0024C0C15F|nr:hypothetical protein [Brevibacillus agri]MED4573107.1 hypothetical protein [Brevibacillus agri]WHX32639.1 hypothetical protein QNK09_10720 [Brevibacillus agri]
MTKNVEKLVDADGYRREVPSFVAGKPGVYTIYYGIDYKENGQNVRVYLSTKITVEKQ